MPLSSPFSWSTTRRTEVNKSNANDNNKIETKKETGLVSKERQLARLRERMAEEDAITVACLGQKKQQVPIPCGRCVDRVVAP